jgi:hypothetical protein
MSDLDPNVIHAESGKSVPLSTIALTGEILACPANIAILCQVIARLANERVLWLEPSKEMIQAGLGEVQRQISEQLSSYHDLDEISDDDASDFAVFVLQAMASKRYG